MNLVATQRIQDSIATIEEGQLFGAEENYGRQLIRSGEAVEEGTRLVWPVLNWAGATVVIIASGPSLTLSDCERVKNWHNGKDHRAIVINTSFERALWADILYACDIRWWDHYYARAAVEFTGELWTQEIEAVQKYSFLHYIPSQWGQGLCRKVGTINLGERPGYSNSGYQATALAHQAGVVRAILLGFDMGEDKGKTHWHSPHPGKMLAFPVYDVWISQFKRLAVDLKKVGMEVINATPRSALDCFPRKTLEEALG